MRPAFAAVSVAIVASIPGFAWAAEPSRAASSAEPLWVELAYELDPNLTDCPNQSEFRELVIRQVGYDPFRTPAALRVTARAERTAHGIEGSLEWRSPEGAFEGERKLSSPARACQEFAAKLSFAIAVQIQLLTADPDAPPREGADGRAARAEPNPSASSTVKADLAPKRAAQLGAGSTASHQASNELTPAWFGAIGLGSALGVGLGSEVTTLGRLFVAAHRGSVALELGAEGSWPTTLQQPDGAGFKRQWILGSLALCKEWQGLSACALGKLGQVRVRGFGVDNVGRATGLVAQTGARLSAELKLSERAALLPRAEVTYAPGRWQVQLNRASAWETARLTGVLGIDFGWNF